MSEQGETYNYEVDEMARELLHDISEFAGKHDDFFNDGLTNELVLDKKLTDFGSDLQQSLLLTVYKDVVLMGDDSQESEVAVDLTSEFTIHNLSLSSFPDDILKRLVEYYVDDTDSDEEDLIDWADRLYDQETEFSVGYRQEYSLNEGGLFHVEDYVVVYVDDIEVEIPATRSNEISAVSALDGQSADELSSVLSESDYEYFVRLGTAVMSEFRPTKVIDDLYENIATCQFMTTKQRLQSMRNIIADGFAYSERKAI